MNPAAIENLKKQVRGEVLQPSDAGYDEARCIYNAMIDRRPTLIIRCLGTPDVVAGVRLAREHELPLSVRGGGHSVSGNSVCDGGVMLDMSKMKGIEIDRQKRIAKAEPGLTLGDFDKATTAQELVTTMGVVSLTGIAGLTLGGGLGWLMGKYGLACDNLIGAEVVTADGNTVRGNHCGLETKSSIVITDPGHLVATIGLENLIVVQCGDATLVADRTNEEAVKQLVERMRQLGFEQFL